MGVDKSVCMLYGFAVYYVLYVPRACYMLLMIITYGGIAYTFNHEIDYIINLYYPYNDKITVDYVNSM